MAPAAGDWHPHHSYRAPYDDVTIRLAQMRVAPITAATPVEASLKAKQWVRARQTGFAKRRVHG